MLVISLKARSCRQERCPYCHGELGTACKACDRCHTLHHPECLAELGRCTVLGCSGSRRGRSLGSRQHRWGTRGRFGSGPSTRRSGGPLRWLGGFALLGLLLCVLTPYLIPHGRHGHGNEAAAIGGLKAITMAQTLFREGDKDMDGTLSYSPTLVQLTNTGSSKQEDLIDEVLAGGTKQGYVFAITSSSEFGWTANANPAIPGTTGDRYFGANMSGLIFFNSERPVQFSPDGSSDDPVLGR